MPSRVSRALAALLAAGCVAGAATAQEPPAAVANATGPSGTSSEARYDAVGYAAVADGAGITVAHRTLPAGSFVEITALDSGRTIVALVERRDPASTQRLVELSAGAARALGFAPGAVVGVRVRELVPAPGDQAALRGGRAGEPRIDAPPVLLTALRKRLAGRGPESPGAAQVAPPAAPAPETARKVPATPARGGRFYVQVAALSDRARADALAARLGGRVASAGALHRVQLGPFMTPREAKAARDDAARRGYADSRILQIK